MNPDLAINALQKPTPHRLVKARQKRQESTVKKSTREQTVERDGHCLILTRIVAGISVLLGPCEGPSEWAHVGSYRRCFTRGQAPHERHKTAGTAQLCQKHHRAYDAHEFDIETYNSLGMDGPIGIIRRNL